MIAPAIAALDSPPFRCYDDKSSNLPTRHLIPYPFGDMMIKALIYDIDNTLYCYDTAHEAALRALADAARRSLGVPAEEFSALHQEAYRIQQERAGIQSAAIHNRLIRCQIILERLGQPVSHAPRMAEIYWSAFLSHMRPFPGTEASMAFAKAAGLAVGVGTNMTADYQFMKLERLGLMKYLDFMVTSEEAGAEKPDGRLFELCVKKAGCSAGECAFIGDSLQLDALGAKQAGLCPVWLCAGADRRSAPPGVYCLPTLGDLPNLLRSLPD